MFLIGRRCSCLARKRTNAALRNIARSAAQQAVAIEQQRKSVPKRRKRNRRKNNTRQSGTVQTTRAGTVSLKHSELWKTVTSTKNATSTSITLTFSPGQTGLKYLDSFANLFDRYRIVSATVSWKSSCSVTTNGSVMMGIDWDPKGNGMTGTQISTLDPNRRGPVRNSLRMVLPRDRPMAQRYLFTSSDKTMDKEYDITSFVLQAYFTHDSDSSKQVNLGDLFIEYELMLTGPRPPPSS